MFYKFLKIIVLTSILSFFQGFFVSAEEDYQKYQFLISEPNGTAQYYMKAPTIKIIHKDSNYVTKYRLQVSDGQVNSGVLRGINSNVTFLATDFENGDNSLDIWMENEQGDMLLNSAFSKKIKLDMELPKISEFIRKEETDTVEIQALDKISGVKGIYYGFDGETDKYTEGDNIVVKVPTEFSGVLKAYAVDYAGNKGETCELQSIEKKIIVVNTEAKERQQDTQAPEIVIKEFNNYKITDQPLTLSCHVSDNQELDTVTGWIVCEDEMGKQIKTSLNNWKPKKTEYYMEQCFINDGIYRFEIKATDTSGNVQKRTGQFLIDKTPPKICKINKLENTCLESFQWEYNIDDMVSDFTTCRYEAKLDGILCRKDKIYDAAGEHVLELNVTDLAGNKTTQIIHFSIEITQKTPIKREEAR